MCDGSARWTGGSLPNLAFGVQFRSELDSWTALVYIACRIKGRGVRRKDRSTGNKGDVIWVSGRQKVLAWNEIPEDVTDTTGHCWYNAATLLADFTINRSIIVEVILISM